MANNMTFFPVGNGDMTLITTDKNINILMDCNMRKARKKKLIMIMIVMNIYIIICKRMMV